MRLYSPYQLATLKWRERLICAFVGLLVVGIPPLLISIALAVMIGIIIGIMLIRNLISVDEIPTMTKSISNIISMGLSLVVIVILIYLAYNIHKYRHLEKIERILIILSIVGVINSYGIVTSIGAAIRRKEISEEGEISIKEAMITSFVWIILLLGAMYYAKTLLYNIGF